MNAPACSGEIPMLLFPISITSHLLSPPSGGMGIAYNINSTDTIPNYYKKTKYSVMCK